MTDFDFEDHKGGISVTASSGGKEITLNPIRTHTLEIEAREVENTIPAGFRQGWASGELQDGTGRKFDINCGAGLGSPWLTFHVEDKDGNTIYQGVMHAEDIVGAWLKASEPD